MDTVEELNSTYYDFLRKHCQSVGCSGFWGDSVYCGWIECFAYADKTAWC